MHRKEVGAEVKGCVIAESLEPSPGQAMNEMVVNGMEDAGTRSFCRGMRMTGADGFYYSRVFRRNETVDCFVLKGLRLAVGEVLRRKAVSDMVTGIDAEEQASTARLQKELIEYERQADARSTADSSDNNISPRRDRDGSSGSSSGGGSLSEPNRKCNGKD